MSENLVLRMSENYEECLRIMGNPRLRRGKLSENEFWEPTTLSGQVVRELLENHDFVGVKIKQKVEIWGWEQMRKSDENRWELN